jgi:fibro-slime domain-containing protein
MLSAMKFDCLCINPGIFGRGTLGLLLLGMSVASVSGCSGSDGSGGATGSGGGTVVVLPGGGASSVAGSGSGNAPGTPYVLPAGFTAAEYGGYKLGDPFNGDKPPASVSQGSSDCSNILGVVRDFNGAKDPNGHPDFEAFAGSKPTTGLVTAALGSDQKPSYTGICEKNGSGGQCPYGQQTTTKANFDEWYRYTANVNKPYVIYLSLQPNNGVLTFQSHAYFPLDNTGWGNQGRAHNFHFTTEIHTQFQYNGGESFTFIGDDDVWVFINNKLLPAIDLGGLHPEATGTVNLDQAASSLGLTKGKIYALDLFHAERHTDQSNFRIDSNLMFTNCGVIVAEPPPH